MSDQTNVKKDRGWLRVLIPLYILGSGLSTLTILLTLLVTDDPFSLAVVPGLFFSPLLFVFSVASWRWKKWGCFGIISLTFLAGLYFTITAFQFWILGGLAAAAASAIQIWIMYALYNSKKQYFE